MDIVVLFVYFKFKTGYYFTYIRVEKTVVEKLEVGITYM